MTYNTLGFSAAAALAVMFFGCGGGSSDSNITPADSTQNSVHRLQAQNGADSYLFFGNTDHKNLDSVTNIKVIEPNRPDTPLTENGDTTDVRYPVVTTAITGYDGNGSRYSGLHTVSASYVSQNNPYKIPLAKTAGTPVQTANSDAVGIRPAGRSFRYTKINYLGSRQYLVAKDGNGSRILITPDMGASDAPLPFENKTLLALAYPAYGEAVNGYIVYDSNKSEVQNCSVTMTACTDIAPSAKTPIYLGDLGGSSKGVIVIDGTGYTLDKSDNSLEELTGLKLPPKTGHATPYQLSGHSIIMFENGNVSRYDIDTRQTNAVASDGKTERLHGFTREWVFFGSDGLIEAARKDGTTRTPIVLSETTATQGHKYITNFGIGRQYLYVTYTLDPLGQTRFRACVFEDENNRHCLDNSFWAAIVPAKEGILDFTASYPYTPYAYVRIDDTDNYGGGKLKAIDPQYPLEDGITMGEIARYNFQRFMQTSRYYDQLIDSNGSIVLYAKDDTTVTENAFLVNLRQPNSLVNLTNEAPAFNQVNKGGLHCHGRYCMLCHSFAGGKMYEDRNGTKTAVGYNIKFMLKDGTEQIARLGKGKGENFNLPVAQLKQNFVPVIIHADDNRTAGSYANTYEHQADHINCNFCHGRNGEFHDGAMSAIAVGRTK